LKDYSEWQQLIKDLNKDQPSIIDLVNKTYELEGENKIKDDN